MCLHFGTEPNYRGVCSDEELVCRLRRYECRNQMDSQISLTNLDLALVLRLTIEGSLAHLTFEYTHFYARFLQTMCQTETTKSSSDDNDSHIQGKASLRIT